MTERLDLQRQPKRLHTRKNSRLLWRGYAVLPHSVWGDYDTTPGAGGVTGPPPTGVTRGAPGTFTPPGCDIPGTLAELTAYGSLGQTVTWTTGQYVNLDPTGSAYWNGTAWALGVKP